MNLQLAHYRVVMFFIAIAWAEYSLLDSRRSALSVARVSLLTSTCGKLTRSADGCHNTKNIFCLDLRTLSQPFFRLENPLWT